MARRKKRTRREIGLCIHAAKRADAIAQASHNQHRIVVRAPNGALLVDSTIAELRAAEVKRDGLGNCVRSCTYVQL